MDTIERRCATAVLEPRSEFDEDLLHRIASGEDAAWRLVVARFRRVVHRRGYQVGLDPDEVQDVEQRVWSRLWAHAGQIRDPRCLPGWIATTARREALALVESRRRAAERLGDGSEREEVRTPPDLPDDDPLQAVLDRERSQVLRSALQSLPQRQRLLLQAIADGLSYAEISRGLAMPPGSIGPTRARAMARLRVGVPDLADL